MSIQADNSLASLCQLAQITGGIDVFPAIESTCGMLRPPGLQVTVS